MFPKISRFPLKPKYFAKLRNPILKKTNHSHPPPPLTNAGEQTGIIRRHDFLHQDSDRVQRIANLIGNLGFRNHNRTGTLVDDQLHAVLHSARLQRQSVVAEVQFLGRKSHQDVQPIPVDVGQCGQPGLELFDGVRRLESGDDLLARLGLHLQGQWTHRAERRQEFQESECAFGFGLVEAQGQEVIILNYKKKQGPLNVIKKMSTSIRWTFKFANQIRAIRNQTRNLVRENKNHIE